MSRYNLWDFPFVSFCGCEHVSGILPKFADQMKEGDDIEICYGEIVVHEGCIVHYSETASDRLFSSVEITKTSSGAELPAVYRLYSAIVRLGDFEKNMLIDMLKKRKT